MKVIDIRPDANGMINWPTLSSQRKSVVTIGVFDGMHQGHREVIRQTVALAQRHEAFSVVIMFDPRPAVVHNDPDRYDDFGTGESPIPHDPEELMSVRQRLRAMAQLGVDHVLIVRYSLAFAAKSYRFFLGQIVGKLGMRTLVLGSDAALGARRAGTVEAISDLARATGVFELVVVENQGPGEVRVPDPIQASTPSEVGDPKDPTEAMNKAEYRAWTKSMPNRKVRAWSSSHVRWMLASGRVHDACEILSQPHRVEGVVVHGQQRGRELGFPTVNLGEHIEGYVPVDGVYAGWLIDLDMERTIDAPEGSNHTETTIASASMLRRDDLHLGAHSPWRWPAAISIGMKPTFGGEPDSGERMVEAYALTEDWKDLYGHRVCIEFAHYLRPQQAFASVDELKAALAHDVESTRALITE